jgi:spore coat protein U-like protein
MKETWTRRAKVALTGLAFVALFGVALQGLISTPQGLAGDNATVNVLANVVGNCKFTTASATLNFGNLDPAVGGDVNATTTLTFWCTKRATYTITDNDGSNSSGTQQRMKHASLTEYIPYNFCYKSTGPAPTPCTTDTTSDTGTGAGKTSPITLNISGTVLESNYIDASAGSYSDTVTMTINP